MQKKEDIIELLNNAPKKSLSDLEKQIIQIIIERSKVQRESALSIVNKGFFTFFVVLGIVYYGKKVGFMPDSYLNILFIFGVFVLIFSLFSYYSVVKKEENLLNRLLDSYLK